jgi:uncharacterized protein YndB with AHSA1/START domain
MNKMPPLQVTAGEDAIIVEVEIAAPPERVFRALTDPAQLILWWTDDVCRSSLWQIDARKGGKWRFEASDSSGKTVVNGVSEFKAYGEITEFDPPRALAYTWLANWHDHPQQASLARWELSASEIGTRVKVTHSGLSGQPIARKDYAGGWPGLLVRFRKYFE